MKKLFAIIFTLFFVCSYVFAQDEKVEKYEGKGYLGTLPDLTRNFTPSEPQTTKPTLEQIDDFHSANYIKPIPRDNPTFVNIMLKKDKTSQYINDLNEIIPMLEKICDSIENREDVQLFNAKVYFFNKNAEYLHQKYIEKPEGQYISFKQLMELNVHAKSVALLRAEAQKYSPYVAYGGSGQIYDPVNIDNQLEFLRNEIEQIITLLKEAD